MRRQEWYNLVDQWERDLRNRQRNIVFPDTVLNEGRFYRHMFSDKASFTLLQRLGIIVLALQFLWVGSMFLTGELSALAQLNGIERMVMGVGSIPPLAMIGFGALLGVRALWRNPKPKPRYRSSYRGPGRAYLR